MNNFRFFLVGTCLSVLAGAANARDDVQQFSIADFMANRSHAEKLEGVRFFFADQIHPPITKEFGEDRTNLKTNAFGKSDAEACEWVMLSAMLALHRRAQQLGANAVINIRSNYKNKLVSSSTEYTCGAGAFVAGVALIADFVIIEGENIEASAETPED